MLSAAIAAGAVIAVLIASPVYAAQTFTVNTTLDATHPGGCRDDAVCSLRDAIQAANTTAGADTVVLPLDTYRLASALPAITDTLAIQGARLDARTTTISR